MASLVLVAATACSDDCPMIVLDDCIESSVSLQQGVYGRVVSQQDVRIDDCPGQSRPWPQNSIALYVIGSDTPVVEDVSDSNGIYELPAAAGDYMVCRSVGNCTNVTVPDGGRVRVDIAAPFTMFTVRTPATCEP
jgi:hypothetical protein